MNRIRTALAILLIASSTAARADEGMWMVNAISDALTAKMQAKGLELPASAIYNPGQAALTDAIVALDFGGTGSFISDRGLLITNHHCAYADIHALSTREHNYLRDGFIARDSSEEIYIPGKRFYILKEVLDVTDEAMEIRQRIGAGPMSMRKLSYLMEKEYSEKTGLEASLSSMWAGSKYYMALYTVYTDIRLVAAPPESIGAFGGDIDNWEWPQHKCDFALYRVYAAPDGNPAPHSDRNVPLKPKRHLKISTEGYDKGSFAMVLGFPGITHRYSSSAEVRFKQETKLPVSNRLRGQQMEIINRWMNADPDVRLKYADRYFSLSNVQELQSGEVECYRRFKVIKEKERMEKRTRNSEILALVDSLEAKYAELEQMDRNLEYYRESIIRCSRIGTIATRLKNFKGSQEKFNYERDYAPLDMRVEKDLFLMGMREYYENVDPAMWGPYQKKLYDQFTRDGACDFDAMGKYLWVDRYMTREDPIFKFLNDVNMGELNKAKSLVEGPRTVAQMTQRYTRELYDWREEHGVLQYPDANSTLRLTYGTVSTFKRDGKTLPWQTFSDEILAKENPQKFEFSIKPDWKANLQGKHIPVDFTTDCDITGGNSGSPVLNGRGEIIGLAFDGNKESLAGDSSWTPVYNKCICADIRFVLFTLENYMGLKYLIDEINGI